MSSDVGPEGSIRSKNKVIRHLNGEIEQLVLRFSDISETNRKSRKCSETDPNELRIEFRDWLWLSYDTGIDCD